MGTLARQLIQQGVQQGIEQGMQKRTTYGFIVPIKTQVQYHPNRYIKPS